MRNLGWLSVLVLGQAGCSVSPRPEPPPVEQPPTVDVDRIVVVPCGGACDTNGIGIQAPAGALSDPQAQGWIVNLDRLDPPTVFDASPDGSFSAFVEASQGDEIRLHFRRDDLRSVPIDFSVSDAQSSIELSQRALADCLLLEPATRLAFDVPGPTVASVRVSNDCEEAVGVTRVGLRLANTPYVIRSQAGPFTIAAHEQSSIEIELTDSTSTVPDVILFFEVDSPLHDRRPITLYPVGL